MSYWLSYIAGEAKWGEILNLKEVKKFFQEIKGLGIRKGSLAESFSRRMQV